MREPRRSSLATDAASLGLRRTTMPLSSSARLCQFVLGVKKPHPHDALDIHPGGLLPVRFARLRPAGPTSYRRRWG